MFAVAGPAVTSAPVMSMPGLLVAEYPWKRHQVMDPKEREVMLANYEDWWASGRSTPWPGLSSALQPPLLTPPVVPVPGPSSALAVPAAAAPCVSSRSMASFSRCSQHSPRPCPAPAPAAISWELPVLFLDSGSSSLEAGLSSSSVGQSIRLCLLPVCAAPSGHLPGLFS